MATDVVVRMLAQPAPAFAEVDPTHYRADHSTVRTRSGPRVLASLRNLAIGALRLADAATSPRPPGGPAVT